MEEFGCLITKSNQGRHGDKKYLVSAVWWRQWCDYVNFDLQNEINGTNNLAFRINNNLLLGEVPLNQYRSVPHNPKRDRYLIEDNKFRKAQFEQPVIEWNHLQSEE